MTWKLHAVGTGSAFNTKDFQSNFLIESSTGKFMLFDCGSMIQMPLLEYGIHSGNVGEKIDAVYVSHLHADHIGGLEWLAFCSYFNPKKIRPKLFCVGGRQDDLLARLWNESLRGGLGSLQAKVCSLTDYFDGHPIAVNTSFYWEGLKCTPVQTVHIMNGMEIVPSYGLMIASYEREIAENTDPSKTDRIFFEKDIGPRVFLTSDTQFCPHQIKDFYKQAGVIIHDCETAPYYSQVHSHYDDLKTLPKETKAKMWLTHYQPDPKQEPEKDGFRGFLKRKQILEF